MQLNASRGYDEKRIGALLHDHFHFQRWIRLNPLDGEPTGHADMFFTMYAPNKCFVGVYRPEQDGANARILDENAGILKGEETTAGPMEVARLPMPSHADGNWRSYANVIYANGVVLVPQYPSTDRDLDKIALQLFRDALPDWKVVGIDCDTLIKKRGALHCISRQLPLPKRALAAVK
jgi:agmatine/peptidylarginine deiminase